MTEKSPLVSHYNGRSRPMRVLNLGLFRTGTSSLREALALLGYSKVYHMDYVFQHRPEDSKFWLRAFDFKYRGKGAPITREEWDTVLGDSDAVSDFPCAAFCKELVEAYPEAKVILTVRDSPEAWHRSALRTVWYVHMRSPFAPHKLLGQPAFEPLLPNLFRMGKRMFSDVFGADLPGTGIDVYNAHIERIRGLMPPERLLVYNVKQGWGPLCEFLGAELPEHMKGISFPRVNEGQAVVEKVLAKQAVVKRKIRMLLFSVLFGLEAIALMFRQIMMVRVEARSNPMSRPAGY